MELGLLPSFPLRPKHREEAISLLRSHPYMRSSPLSRWMNEKELKGKWMSERKIRALSVGCEISDYMNKGLVFQKVNEGASGCLDFQHADEKL